MLSLSHSTVFPPISLKCIAADPGYVRGHVRAGRSYLAMGKAAAAKARFNEAIGQAKTETSARFVEDAKRGMKQCTDYEDKIREGEQQLSSHNYNAAISNADAALNISPHSRHASLLKYEQPHYCNYDDHFPLS